MVGVPGRSRGCRTCRRRRKGCDLRRPICIRCEQGGFVCMGYNDSNRIVVYDTTEALQQTKQIQRRNYPVTDLPKSLQSSAIKSLSSGLAWDSLHQCKGKASSYAWIPSLAAVHVNDTAVNVAYTAVSLARNGQQMDNREMVRESFVAYTKAISRVGSLFQDRNAMVTDEVLGAILLLALYETMQGSSNPVPAWVSHIRGAVELIHIRGPAAHVTCNGHALLQDIRLHAVSIIYKLNSEADAHSLEILDAVVRRKRTFLSTTSWLQKPWENVSKSPKDSLLDIISSIPELLEHGDKLKYRLDLPTSLVDLYAMRNSYSTLTAQLDGWQILLEDQQNTPPYWYEPAKAFSDTAEHHLHNMYPAALRFVDLERAELYVLYWTIQLVLHGNFFMMYHVASLSPTSNCEVPNTFPHLGSPNQATFFMDLFDPLETLHSSWQHANNIAESLEYFLDPNQGAIAANIVIFPVIVCIAFMKLFGHPKLQFFQGMIRKFEERLHIPLGAFINNAAQREDVKLVK